MTNTLFSWGYWGWGESTEQLLQATESVERARGFKPPMFVDVRLLRQGRAKGFVGDAFRDLVGASRYCWMPDLGNPRILNGKEKEQIKNPAAAADLLKLALQQAKERRRVIFYCACEFPIDENKDCHRLEIIKLLFANAKKMNEAISIVEWPGGEPDEIRIKVNRKLFSMVIRNRKRRMSIPFENEKVRDYAGLPWGTLATLKCQDDGTTGQVLVGPAKFSTSKTGNGYWYVPVIEPAGAKEKPLRQAHRWRAAHGLNEQKSR